MKEDVVAFGGLKEFLFEGQPGSFVDPHLDFDDLFANFVGFGNQLKDHDFFPVNLALGSEGYIEAFLDVRAAGTKAEADVLVDQRAVLAEIEFLNAINLRSVDKERIAIAQDGAFIGRQEINAHFVVFMEIQKTGFGRGVVYDGGEFDVLDVGGQGMKILCGTVHKSENAVGGPVRRGLRGGQARNGQGEEQREYCQTGI